MVSGVLRTRQEYAAFMLKSGVWTNPGRKFRDDEFPNASDFPLVVVIGWNDRYARPCVDEIISRSEFFSTNPERGPVAELVAIHADPTGKALWDTFVADPDDMIQAGVLADWCKEQGYGHVEFHLRAAIDRGYLS